MDEMLSSLDPSQDAGEKGTPEVENLQKDSRREDRLTRFTALVHIFADSSRIDRVERALSKLDNLEAMFEVTGEFDIVALISAADTAEFREILKNKIRSIEGVKATAISVVLKDIRAAMV